MVVLYVLIALVVVGLLTGVHWYVWRRLVRDTTARGGWARRTGTTAAFALPLISVGALVAGRAGAPFPLQRALAWPGYLWLALLLYLTLALLAGEAVRPLLRAWLSRNEPAGVRSTEGPEAPGSPPGGLPTAFADDSGAAASAPAAVGTSGREGAAAEGGAGSAAGDGLGAAVVSEAESIADRAIETPTGAAGPAVAGAVKVAEGHAAKPTAEAAVKPTAEATAEPTAEAAVKPTAEATAELTAQAAVKPTAEATAELTAQAAVKPTAEATAELTAEAAVKPTAEATAEPTAQAAVKPTAEATAEPTAQAAAEPTAQAAAKGGAADAAPASSRRLFVARAVAVGATAVAAGTVGYGTYTVLRGPRVKRITVPLAKLPRRAHGFRIAVVSDIHLGPILGRDHTRRVVEAVNRANADLVAVVGDLVDGSVADLGPAAEPLRGLRARHGSYFVTGNHEYYSGAAEWVDHVRELGLRPLENERAELPGFDLAGVNDIAGESEGHGPDFGKALGDRDRSRAAVLLAHQPVVIHDAVKAGVDLQLSGHTHGGQLWPGNYVAELANPTAAGLDRYGDTQLYVTRGAGAWGPPVRVGVPPDVTVVELASTRA
ncbi:MULTISPECIES: metallophosphoesterase [Streptomyces violaceusniger group]|uniref:Metallophosphoesterase n=2 Tax=Streptomyces javensis TaxID=114698 RepID=A0ABS0RJ02_9ACTN|nr:metallophosphoesterase [Streptomyces javensis]MBI0317397.1 metallophosphoesterase [Streptomyces javensis]